MYDVQHKQRVRPLPPPSKRLDIIHSSGDLPFSDLILYVARIVHTTGHVVLYETPIKLPSAFSLPPRK